MNELSLTIIRVAFLAVLAFVLAMMLTYGEDFDPQELMLNEL